MEFNLVRIHENFGLKRAKSGLEMALFLLTIFFVISCCLAFLKLKNVDVFSEIEV